MQRRQDIAECSGCGQGTSRISSSHAQYAGVSCWMVAAWPGQRHPCWRHVGLQKPFQGAGPAAASRWLVYAAQPGLQTTRAYIGSDVLMLPGWCPSAPILCRESLCVPPKNAASWRRAILCAAPAADLLLTPRPAQRSCYGRSRSSKQSGSAFAISSWQLRCAGTQRGGRKWRAASPAYGVSVAVFLRLLACRVAAPAHAQRRLVLRLCRNAVVAGAEGVRHLRDWCEQRGDDFFNDPRNLLLGLFVDGFNPFNSGTYSIYSIYLVIFNLPPEVRQRSYDASWCLQCICKAAQPVPPSSACSCVAVQVRTKSANMLLWGLVDGPKSPKNLQLYLKRLVEELTQLFDVGVPVFDACRGETFVCRAMCPLIIMDNRCLRQVAGLHDAGNLNLIVIAACGRA